MHHFTALHGDRKTQVPPNSESIMGSSASLNQGGGLGKRLNVVSAVLGHKRQRYTGSITPTDRVDSREPPSKYPFVLLEPPSIRFTPGCPVMKRLGVKQRLKDPTTQMLQPSWALALDGSLGRCEWNAKEGEVMLFVRIGTSRTLHGTENDGTTCNVERGRTSPRVMPGENATWCVNVGYLRTR